LGITIGQTTVAKYMVRQRRPPSQTWRTFLNNHAKTLVSVDFFTVPTIRFQVLYVFLVLAHERRRVVHFNVTAHPTAEWTAQQLREAFPFEQIPRYLLRDRDKIFGDEFGRQVRDMNIEEVLSAPRSPWQRAYVERLIGSIRRECLDHVIVCNETSLHRILTAYFSYYHATRPHLSLEKDSPEPRKVHPPGLGRVLSIPSRRSSPSLRTTRRLKRHSQRPVRCAFAHRGVCPLSRTAPVLEHFPSQGDHFGNDFRHDSPGGRHHSERF
jgi:putative transposase